MAEAQIPYKRIGAWSVKRMTGQRLWLNGDHLLSISSHYITEHYKRFYFNDIQAITITRTVTGMLINVALGILAGTFFLWAVFAYMTPGWSLGAVSAIGVIAAFCTVFLALNIVLGPTCRCYLYTAVHCEELFCLGRVRRARRVIRNVQPLIEAAQEGTLSDGDMDALRMRQGDVYGSPAMLVETAARGKTPLRRESGTVHMALFAVLIIDAMMSVIALIQPAAVPMPVSLSVLLTVIALTVTALIRQANSTLPRQLRSVTWATFFYICLTVFFLWGVMIADQVVREMDNQDVPPDLVAFQAGLGQVVSAISVIFDVLLSTFGLRVLWEYRNRSKVATGPSPASLSEQE